MSHELRTPLAAILGYAELIQEGFYEPQGPKSLDALTRIRSNGKHLLGLINTVLDIAKIESGQFTLNMTEYAMESVVETVRSSGRAAPQEPGSDAVELSRTPTRRGLSTACPQESDNRAARRTVATVSANTILGIKVVLWGAVAAMLLLFGDVRRL
jgi:signal transduction histidine kinase